MINLEKCIFKPANNLIFFKHILSTNALYFNLVTTIITLVKCERCTYPSVSSWQNMTHISIFPFLIWIIKLFLSFSFCFKAKKKKR